MQKPVVEFMSGERFEYDDLIEPQPITNGRMLDIFGIGSVKRQFISEARGEVMKVVPNCHFVRGWEKDERGAFPAIAGAVLNLIDQSGQLQLPDSWGLEMIQVDGVMTLGHWQTYYRGGYAEKVRNVKVPFVVGPDTELFFKFDDGQIVDKIFIDWDDLLLEVSKKMMQSRRQNKVDTRTYVLDALRLELEKV